ncbi:MAG TPA: transferrin receptor-like dimerization domain-containing protein [Blastocatellia bacterium]|nr:transferrin receptor-like dimerization domain-containing protein [Blastocatellia bacterium]HMV85906.1 transferrin receptor-like dimerization domain-containing protein [Blastocatellia bacterium]HMX27142.1 transferrin receptor-like dimerization domain-containing protein [Blastocatellia bacterium]HMY74987.1 transferrin receptor-like dimerization domain-containing protein [Blastocatellia bacterium]HMZ20735.1 transferrin receptor-like dimerization domain-containing protein [Blastocatellia bacteri
MRSGYANRILAISLALLLAVGSITSWTNAAQNHAENNWEKKFRSIPQAERLKEYMRRLSAEPHHIGSIAGKRNAEWMRDQMKAWGIEAKLEEFDVLFPTPKERVLELVTPEKYTAKLKEPVLAEDPDSGDENQLPTYNAYSGDGDVTAPLVYVNYGIPADYEQLAKMGVDVKGKIVIARYGASWRGIKPKVAYEHGAVGCLIYSDPKEDGYFQGDVYPKGPYRPDASVQRGSVMDMPVHPGDPLTPGWGATKNARRLSREEAKTLMKIPVLPISYGDALPLLKSLGGQVVPEAWRGALPITYHVGGAESAKARLKVVSEWRLHTLYNVIGRIEGGAYPDEWVIRGNHHDAWVNGADDPISGMAAVLEEARAFGELLKQGWRPKRTIIFCAWDGEEPGLLGSTEWVEEHAEELKQKAVVYINSDSTSKGTFGVGGSHTLEKFVNDVARSINDPKGKGTLWEVMKSRRGEQTGGRADLRISALGSGSDYTAFIDHLGIASLNVGFGGEVGGGIYHSIYDSFTWYTRFSDTTFEYGRTLVQAAGTATIRLADARILPFEFTNFAETVGGYVDEIARLPKQNVDLMPLRRAVEKLTQASDDYDRALNAVFRTGSLPAEAKELNKLLFQSERKLLSAAGLPRREWFKHQIYAPGFYTGYGVKTLPGVREALEQKNWAEASEQVKVIATTLDGLSAQIVSAASKLQER